MVEPERTTEDRHAEPYEQKPAEPERDVVDEVRKKLGEAFQ